MSLEGPRAEVAPTRHNRGSYGAVGQRRLSRGLRSVEAFASCSSTELRVSPPALQDPPGPEVKSSSATQPPSVVLADDVSRDPIGIGTRRRELPGPSKKVNPHDRIVGPISVAVEAFGLHGAAQDRSTPPGCDVAQANLSNHGQQRSCSAIPFPLRGERRKIRNESCGLGNERDTSEAAPSGASDKVQRAGYATLPLGSARRRPSKPDTGRCHLTGCGSHHLRWHSKSNQRNPPGCRPSGHRPAWQRLALRRPFATRSAPYQFLW